VRILVVLAASLGLANAQTITIGVKAGVPLTPNLDAGSGFYIYVVGGPSFGVHYGFSQKTRTIRALDFSGYSDVTTSTTNAAEFPRHVSKGLAAGAGIDIPSGIFRIKPEVRYTRWISPAFQPEALLLPVVDEVDLYLGLEFGRGR
jgi:hypothetical protein